MSSKRDLKKYICNVCGDLAANLLMARAAFGGFDNKRVAEIIDEIAELQVNTLSKVSFSYDKVSKDFPDEADYRKARSAYYRQGYDKLCCDFDARVAEIVKEMNAVLPAEAKEQIKATLAK